MGKKLQVLNWFLKKEEKFPRRKIRTKKNAKDKQKQEDTTTASIVKYRLYIV